RFQSGLLLCSFNIHERYIPASSGIYVLSSLQGCLMKCLSGENEMKKPKRSDRKEGEIREKKAQMFRLPPDVADMLLAGSRKTGIKKPAYVIFALKHQSQADGLLPQKKPFPATPSARGQKPAKQ